METVVFTAQSFGFGPVSKMLAISESMHNAKKIFFGDGVAYDLANLHHFDEVYRFSHRDEREIIALLQTADLLVNVMDFPVGKLATISGCPQFIIDVLLWFWPSLPEGVREADVYFCQDFFGTVEAKVKEYGLTNAVVIDPIVNLRFPKSPRIGQAMVSFGGLECEFIEIGKNSNYPFIMLDTILPVLKPHFSQILVAGRERVMQMCRKKYGENSQLKFKMLSRERFLQELCRSRALFMSPGSETLFDAYDKLPIFCLPPQNNSNHRNLDLFIQTGALSHYLHWPEVFDFDLPVHCPNDEAEIKMVLEVISKFANNICGQKKLRDKITIFLEAEERWSDLVAQQKKAVERYGLSGTETIIAAIQQQICLSALKPCII